MIIARQLSALDMRNAKDITDITPEGSSGDTSGLYYWGTDHLEYVGKFAFQRKADREKRAGCVARFMEHQTLTRRPGHRDGGRKKYCLARVTHVSRHCFFVCRSGTHNSIAAQ